MFTNSLPVKRKHTDCNTWQKMCIPRPNLITKRIKLPWQTVCNCKKCAIPFSEAYQRPWCTPTTKPNTLCAFSVSCQRSHTMAKQQLRFLSNAILTQLHPKHFPIVKTPQNSRKTSRTLRWKLKHHVIRPPWMRRVCCTNDLTTFEFAAVRQEVRDCRGWKPTGCATKINPVFRAHLVLYVVCPVAVRFLRNDWLTGGRCVSDMCVSVRNWRMVRADAGMRKRHTAVRISDGTIVRQLESVFFKNEFVKQLKSQIFIPKALHKEPSHQNWITLKDLLTMEAKWIKVWNPNFCKNLPDNIIKDLFRSNTVVFHVLIKTSAGLQTSRKIYSNT